MSIYLPILYWYYGTTNIYIHVYKLLSVGTVTKMINIGTVCPVIYIYIWCNKCENVYFNIQKI